MRKGESYLTVPAFKSMEPMWTQGQAFVPICILHVLTEDVLVPLFSRRLSKHYQWKPTEQDTETKSTGQAEC